jgi:catalase
MLQARIFSYADAHRYRLGTHYEMLPVNASKCPVHHDHKDGPMRFFEQKTGNVDAFYEPNSFGGAVQDGHGAVQSVRCRREGAALSQRGGSHVEHEIVERQLAHFRRVHPDYEAGVRRELDKMTRAKTSEIAQQQKMPQGVEAAE